MKPLEEKKKEWEFFTASDEFGNSTFSILSRFRTNVVFIIRIVELYGMLPTKLDENTIPHEMEESQLTVIKQLIIMDALSRVMAIIEATLILIFGLSKGYKELLKILTRYELTMIDSAIVSIGKREYNMRKILGLPEISLLSLNKEEGMMGRSYQQTIDTVYEALKKCIIFYDKYKIIYGKSRHGLTFWPNMILTPPKQGMPMPDPYILAFDKREKHTMPKDTIFTKIMKNRDDWHNTMSFLKMSEELFSEVNGVLHDIDTLVNFIVTNHILYAENCGQDYLPSMVGEKNQLMIGMIFGQGITNGDKVIYEHIKSKLMPNMHYVNPSLKFQINFEAMSIDPSKTITNFWLDRSS